MILDLIKTKYSGQTHLKTQLRHCEEVTENPW